MIELDLAIQAYLNGTQLPSGELPIYDQDMPGTVPGGLSQLVSPPQPPFGFGSDIACFDDIDPTQEDDPNSQFSIVSANYRRINTPLGFLGLIGEPTDYGFDIYELLQKPLDSERIQTAQSTIQDQILQDDRNKTCVCVITPLEHDGLSIALGGTTSAGPYSLTLALTDASLLITSMNLEAQQNAVF
jgi:hypothetical protein